MSALATDLVRNAAPNFATTLANSVLISDNSINLQAATGLPTGTAITLTIDATDPVSGAPTPTLKETVTGTLSGTTVSNLIRGLDGTTQQAHASGANVVQWFTANDWNDFQTSYLTQHNQLGTHSNVTSTALTNTGTLTQTGTVLLNGAWDGWIGANENWAYASATTITVPTDATTKYAVGDMVKLTQSSTVKHFVTTSLTSTVLTVSGLAGATVANSAITLNYYSKTRNPGTFLAGAIPFNPYKFLVYRNGALGTGAVPAKIPFDTKAYDTGSNVDIVTNVGRFTAPIAGFYKFDAVASIQQGANNVCAIYLYKNGSIYLQSGDIANNGTVNSNVASGVFPPIQLAANDYVEIYFNTTYGAGASFNTGSGPMHTYFGGALVSAV